MLWLHSSFDGRSTRDPYLVGIVVAPGVETSSHELSRVVWRQPGQVVKE